MDGFPNETRYLKCHLTPEETRARTLEMLDELKRSDELTAKLDSIKKEMKDEIAGHESDARKLRMVVHDEAEMRDVECELLPDFKAGIVKVVREDTGEVVDTRPMTPDEKQLALPAIGRAKRRGAVANAGTE